MKLSCNAGISIGDFRAVTANHHRQTGAFVMSAKKSLDLQVCQQACHELSPDRLSEPAMASLRWCHVSLGLRRLIAAAYGTSFCSMIQPSLRIAFTTSGRLANLRETIVLPTRSFVIVSATTPLETRPPSMQMKIGRWKGLYPRIQSAAKHIRCGFVCGYQKIIAPIRSERSTIIGAAQPGVHGPDPSEDRATKKEREQ